MKYGTQGTEQKTGDSIVDTARARYKAAVLYYGDAKRQAAEDARFALGDSVNGYQWPADVMRFRSLGRPCLTINTTAQHCNQIVNNIRMNRPTATVLPADNGGSVKAAELLAGLVRNIQSISNADDAHDIAAEFCVYGGEGFWRIETEYCNDTSMDLDIRITPILNPSNVFIDPAATKLDKSDAEWAIVIDRVGKEEVRRLYNVDPESWEMTGSLRNEWVDADSVLIADYYYVTYEKYEIAELEDGVVVPSKQLEGTGVQPVRTRTVSKRIVNHCTLVGGEDKPVSKTVFPSKYIPIVSVIGKEVNIDGRIERKGLVRDLLDQARMINYSYSAATETIALQNKVPYMASVQAIEGFEDIYANANVESRAYLPYNEYDKSGNRLSKPERQQPSVMPQAQLEMLQLSTEQMRAASGQQSANFGIKSEAASGIGIQRLKQQGEVATFHFPDNLARGLKHEVVILLDLIKNVYNTRRVVSVMGLDGKTTRAIADPDHDEAYTEVKIPDVEALFNPAFGEFNVIIDTGPSYATQRQETADMLMELSTRNPMLMQVAGDLILQGMDIPNSGEIAERLKLTLPENLQKHEDKEQQPEQDMQKIEQQMTQMADQIEQMNQALHQAEIDKEKAENQAQQEKNARLKMEEQLILERIENIKQDAILQVHNETSGLLDK